MSQLFFNELKIPKPNYNLEVGSGSHAEQTGKMLVKLEKVLIREKPDLVLVYGDTNSTLAGALAASKLHIPVGHIEAGLRSFNREMPEETNRVVADHVSNLLFCPTKNAVNLLKKEGITKGVYFTGDVMLDAILQNIKIAEKKSKILERLNLGPKEYLLATIHRAENTDDKERLKSIFDAFFKSNEKIVIPLHPRTVKYLKKYRLDNKIKRSKNVLSIKPVGYLDMLKLERNAKKILTDSGGIQKEAYFLKVPCITLRDETEWVETIKDQWNILVRANKDKMLRAIQNFKSSKKQHSYFGRGKANIKISKIVSKYT